MTHTSPTTFAVWSTLSTALGAFLLGHLWRFDKFKCLRWSNTPYSGAFKRIMTYTYLITIPLIMAYSFGFTFIKYKEGFFDIGGIIMPKPYMFWSDEYRAAVFPLMIAFSFAWSFEMVTHLEELCFWYFLITAGPAQPDWFRSMYFRIWVGGSVSALIYLPAVTISFRDNPLRCEARMFFSGSIGDLILTLGFIPVLHRFPGFIQKVKAEGVDSSIVVRLVKFYELNVIRIIFRFLMQLPLLALGIDGLKPHSHHLNESLFWTDLLSIIAALGCVFSSVCTLLIFFPRSYEAEYHAKEASHRRSGRSIASRQSYEPQPAYSQYSDDARNYFEPSPFGKSTTFISQKYLDTDLYEDDYVKYEQTERKMGTGIAKESFGSKLREGERRIARGTRRIGADLHHAFTGRLARLSRRRPRADVEGNSGISWSLGMHSLMQEEQIAKERDTVTRRTTPSARSTTHRSNSAVSPSEDCVGASLKRKGTYLLTDSPVLRAGTANQREKEGRCHPPTAFLETIEPVYESGAGGGALYDTAHDLTSSPVGIHETELHCGDGTFTKPSDYRKDVSDSREDRDIPALALDAPLSSTVLAYSQASGLANLPPNHTPTTDAHIHGPRPIKKSVSVSTAATMVTQRALPTPPMNDPLGATPSYSITDDMLAKSVKSQKQGKKQEEDDNAVIDIRAGLRLHPFGPVSPLDRLDRHDYESFIRPTNPHEPNEVPPLSEPPRSHMAQFGSDQARRVARLPYSPGSATTTSTRHRTFAPHDPELGTATLSGGSVLHLTAANLSRLNSTTRRSRVNPLVRTFTSPIDFLDQIQENSGADCGESGIGPNASRTQIGWAL